MLQGRNIRNFGYLGKCASFCCILFSALLGTTVYFQICAVIGSYLLIFLLSYLGQLELVYGVRICTRRGNVLSPTKNWKIQVGLTLNNFFS